MRRPRRTESPSAAGPGAGSAPDPELLAQRERLTERFALMQSELGGLFYEMAIRDHVLMDVLVAKAAALQAVDAELTAVEQRIAEAHQPIREGTNAVRASPGFPSPVS